MQTLTSKESKLAVFIKELSIRIKREVINEGNFHVRVTVMLSLLMTFSTIILSFFIHDRVRKFMSSPDYDSYYPLLTGQYPSVSLLRSDIPFSSNLPFSNLSNPWADVEERVAPKELWHSMNDSELLWRASMVPQIEEYPYNRTPKLAFMFLTKGSLPLAPLWERFFSGNEGLYSIYLHTSPEYSFEPPQSSVFHKRKIPSQEVEWGKKSMVDAERRLLANALLDHSNERFILLSETCIPVFNFTTIYDHLLNANGSFVSSFDDPRYTGRGRYNRKMLPAVTLAQWRKGSQWFEAHRRLAVSMVSDTRYYAIFIEHCKPPCYMDEHYFPTLVHIAWPELTSNTSLTWVDWSRGGSHPRTVMRSEISSEFLNQIRHGFRCSYNGQITTVCFLFARKFHANTLEPLLDLAPNVIGF